MTKKEFKDRFNIEEGTDEYTPVEYCKYRTGHIIKKSYLDDDVKSVLLQLNEQYTNTLQDLENAIFNLCD